MVASRQAERVTGRYVSRLAEIRKAIDTRVLALFDDIDPDAIDASVVAFVERAAPVITAGQASTAALTAAFIRSLGLARTGELLDLADIDPIVGTTRDGAPLADGMAAIGPMILEQIGSGRPLAEALDFGAHLASRFADNELTGAADRTIDVQARSISVITGWEGIVSPDACDPCKENEGPHDLADEIYRHPDCGCERIPVFG